MLAVSVQVGVVTARYESQAAELRSELAGTQGQRDMLQGQLDITTARLQVRHTAMGELSTN